MDTSLVNSLDTSPVSRPDTIRVVDTFGDRLRAAREASGYSLDKLGEVLGGYTKAAVSKWERNQTEPPLKVLRDLRRMLHVSLDTLVAGESASDATTLEFAPDEIRAVRLLRTMSDRRRAILLEFLSTE